MMQTGILLVNLGTPASASFSDVKRYLLEFLTDGRVIDLPWPLRQLVVRGQIVPRRIKESTKNYKRIWRENGSPLLYWGERVKELLQEALGDKCLVELAMRYQNPSIKQGLEKLKHCQKLVILPLFPQYASATTGSVHQKVMKEVKNWVVIPPIEFIQSYPAQQKMIDAFVMRTKEFAYEDYEHILMSFHGLPERQIKKADTFGCCLKSGCCAALSAKNQFCYAAQCHETARKIAAGLGLYQEQYSVVFQSRLGKDPWIKPYIQDKVEELAKEGIGKLLVLSPAFVCDCLETIDEIGRELKASFGKDKTLDLVPGLNDHPLWIEALKDLCENSSLPQSLIQQ